MKTRDVVAVLALAGGAVLFSVRSGWIKLGSAPKEEEKPSAVAQPPAGAAALPLATAPAPIVGNFATPWQEESQFIVQTIATDLTEMMVFAKSGRPPGKQAEAIQVSEAPGSRDDALIYRVTLPDPQLTVDLPLSAAIWAPSVYQPLVQALAQKLALKGSSAAPADEMVARLTDLRAEVIERANAEVSAALEKNFSAPALHERAALVLAAFTLREHARLFFEIRTELCAMTAHLALARGLRDGSDASVEGRVAEAALTTLYNNEVQAVELAESLAANRAPGVPAWSRALRVRSTGDYRLIKDTPEISLLERLEKFNAEAQRRDNVTTWEQVSSLRESWQNLPDWMRITATRNYTVGIGRVMVDNALGLELGEVRRVYALSQGAELQQDGAVAALNVEPGRCVSVAADGRPQVRVIGWGLWAGFLQRQLCQAVVEDFKVMNKMWAVPDDARAFRDKADAAFAGLRLYPFVRRQNATDDAYYHQAQDDSMALIRRQPHLIPAEAWNNVAYTVPFGKIYFPPPHPFINEWHRHNPPAGTAYDFHPRANHPSLVDRSDTMALLEQLHAIAPWDHDISLTLTRKRYGEKPSVAQIMEVYRMELDYATSPMLAIAEASEANPPIYVEWMNKAAAQAPTVCYRLGDYLVKQGRADDAARAYTDGMARAPDPLEMAAVARWMVNYLEDHHESEKATALADRAAEVYSQAGLEAKASLLERRKEYDDAYAIHQAIVDRYGHPEEVIPFLARMQQAAPNSKYRALFAQAIANGPYQKIELRNLSGAPALGAVASAENDEMRKAGLRQTDVIVGVQGYRVDNAARYTILRETGGPQLTLIIWRDNTYRELKASPPGRRFGVDFNDYHAAK